MILSLFNDWMKSKISPTKINLSLFKVQFVRILVNQSCDDSHYWVSGTSDTRLVLPYTRSSTRQMLHTYYMKNNCNKLIISFHPRLLKCFYISTEGAHDPGELCKYGYDRQAKGREWTPWGSHLILTLEETNSFHYPVIWSRFAKFWQTIFRCSISICVFNCKWLKSL